MTAKRIDVAILGAGVAGLAAARVLDKHGLQVVVLEARERLGGRICTHREPHQCGPIELGAEFIHGDAPETHALLEEAGLCSVDIGGTRFEVRGNRLRPLHDFWMRLHRVLRHLDPAMQPDQSVRQFLDARPGGRREGHNRHLTEQFVEGFLAADARRASARSMAGDNDPSADERAQRMGRVVGGYDRLVAALGSPVERLVRRSVAVTRVRWSATGVAIDSRVVVRTPRGNSYSLGRARPTLRARRAIVALPLGVLQAPATDTGGVEFVPALDQKADALERMAMGSVVRIVLRFGTRFWTADAIARRAGVSSLEALTFVQSSDEDFPVWWTQYPVRTPVVVGWRGGPRADALDRLSDDDLTDRAVQSLARAFAVPAPRLRRQLRQSWIHRWDSDPFARGAYSYQLVDGGDAPFALSRPLGGSLYFAGEATAPDGRLGTVDGAIASGRRAANQIMRALTRARRRP